MKRGDRLKWASGVCRSSNECCSFVICLTTEHIRVLKNSFKCALAIQIEFEFGIRCWFLKRGETGVPGERLFGARKRTRNKRNPGLKWIYGIITKIFFSFVVHIHSNLFLTYETGEWKAWAKFLVEQPPNRAVYRSLFYFAEITHYWDSRSLSDFEGWLFIQENQFCNFI